MNPPETSRDSLAPVQPRLWLLLALLAVGVLFRFWQPAPNVNPIAALALFGGAMVAGRAWWGLLLPLGAMLVADSLLEALYQLGWREYPGFHGAMPAVYGSFVLIIGIGWLIRRRVNVATVLGGSLAGSTLFFLITNFAVWAGGGLGYPHTLEGLGTCYAAGLPFFRTALLGDLAYNGLLFGTAFLAVRGLPRWTAQPAFAPVRR